MVRVHLTCGKPEGFAGREKYTEIGRVIRRWGEVTRFQILCVTLQQYRELRINQHESNIILLLIFTCFSRHS